MAAYNRLADNYYNEFDENAAAWLRELIRRGLIAPGEVDTRSIVDVRPDDLAGYTQCHFFAGIGVWSYAARRAGWPDDRPLWTGSPPCQPFSAAGKGLGTADERHLWPAFFHLIDVCRPDEFFGEQVASKDALAWLDHVSADVEGAGYALGTFDLCAAGFGAPHIRQRLKFVGTRTLADDHRQGRGRIAQLQHGWRENPGERRHDDDRCGPIVRLGDGLGARLEGHAGHGDDPGGRTIEARPASAASEPGGLSVPDDAFWRANLSRRDLDDGTDAGRPEGPGDARTGGSGDGLADACGPRTGRHAGAILGAEGPPLNGCSDASEPCGDTGGWPGPTNGLWGDADWLLCRDGKWRPVEPGTFPLAHGAPARVGRLRGYGNAIVAPAAAHFIASYLEAEAAGFDLVTPSAGGGLIDGDLMDLLA